MEEAETNNQLFNEVKVEIVENQLENCDTPDFNNDSLKSEQPDANDLHSVFPSHSFDIGVIEVKQENTERDAEKDISEEDNSFILPTFQKDAFKNLEGFILYKCNQCTYQTKHKGSFKRHLLRQHETVANIKRHRPPRHNALNNIFMYNCDKCDYKAKLKHVLTRHQVVHKNQENIEKNEGCDYQKVENNGKFECDYLDDYPTTHSEVINHPINKNSPVKGLYKCDECDFQTVYKKSLLRHIPTHKHPEEIETYKCELCSYFTIHKRNLKGHLLIHKNPQEVDMHKCTQCEYQSLRKSDLKRHSLIHKNPEELNIYKCKQCSYQTVRKTDLKKHFLIHQNPQEVETYKCEHCSFQTIHRRSLRDHFLIHKDEEELDMYKCDKCNFETIHKRSLKTHQITHRKSKNTVI